MFAENQDTRAHTGDLIMSEGSPDFSFLGVAAKPRIDDNRPASQCGLWRNGDVLIAKRHIAKFPDRCIKTNKQSVGRIRVWAGCNGITPSSFLKWFLFLVYLRSFGFVGEDLFAIYRRKYIELEMGVGRQVKSRRNWKKLFALLTLFLIIPTIGLSFWLGKLTENVRGVGEMLFLILYFFLPMIPFVLGLMLCLDKPPVKVEKLDDDYALIRGAHPEYLAQFPEWNVPLPV